MRDPQRVFVPILALCLVAWFTPSLTAQYVFTENFDTYIAGEELTPQSPEWDTWDGAAGVDGFIVDFFSSSPSNSLQMTAGHDIVKALDMSCGQVEISAKIYVPTGATGQTWFILLNDYNQLGPYNWSVQVTFNADTDVVGNNGGSAGGSPGGGSLPLIRDAWIEVRVEVDLDNNTHNVFYDDVQLGGVDLVWSGGTGSAIEINAIDLYADTASESYYDDVSVVQTLPDCGPVANLNVSGDCVTGDQTLTWDPPCASVNPVDGIEVSRDGAIIATLASTDTSYVDSTAPAGSVDYEVRSTCGLLLADPASATVTVLTGPPSNVVLRLDDGTGLVDSASIVEQALTNNGEAWIEYSSVADVPCTSSSTVVWCITGSYPDNFALTPEAGEWLRDHVEAGGPLHFEGGDTWGFDAQTVFEEVDGVLNGSAVDGDDTFLSMDGASAGDIDTSDFQDVVYTQDQAGSDYTDRIEPGTDLDRDAVVLWSEGTGLYITGVASTSIASAGRVVAQSWELGGFGGDLDELTGRYRTYLTGGTTGGGIKYIRGNANGDAGFDISDAVFTLSALFVPASPAPNCSDAADSNADGGIDISDAVYTLSALFVPGSPLPSAPHPGCDVGPIVLGCATPQCP